MKNILRKSGVFGIYGSIKSVGGFKKLIQSTTRNKAMFNVFKKIVKKNALRNLHTANFILDLKKFGMRETAKRVVQNRFVPMEFRKLGWFFAEIKKSQSKNKTLREVDEMLMGKGNELKGKMHFHNGMIHITNEDLDNQLELIDGIRSIKTKTKSEKEIVDSLKDRTLVFGVNSPETHNFSQRLHFYNQFTREYKVPIRSGSKAYIRYYTYYNVSWKLVKEAIRKSNFGKNIFSKIR